MYRHSRTQPRWGWAVGLCLPRVAASRQPWAMIRSPFGAKKETVRLRFSALGKWLHEKRTRKTRNGRIVVYRSAIDPESDKRQKLFPVGYLRRRYSGAAGEPGGNREDKQTSFSAPPPENNICAERGALHKKRVLRRFLSKNIPAWLFFCPASYVAMTVSKRAWRPSLCLNPNKGFR